MFNFAVILINLRTHKLHFSFSCSRDSRDARALIGQLITDHLEQGDYNTKALIFKMAIGHCPRIGLQFVIQIGFFSLRNNCSTTSDIQADADGDFHSGRRDVSQLRSPTSNFRTTHCQSLRSHFIIGLKPINKGFSFFY